jgi:hypothetical protein
VTESKVSAVLKDLPAHDLDSVVGSSDLEATPRSASQFPRLKRWVPWIVLAAVLILLIHFVDLRATLRAFSDIAPTAIVLTVAFYLLDRFSMAFKWNILLRARGLSLSHWAAFRIYLASGFVGYVIPASVGSDVFRVARLTIAGRSGTKVSATIVLERVLGLLAILLLSFVGLLFTVLRGRTELLPLLGAVGAALLLGSALTAMSMSSRLYVSLKRATHRFGANPIVKTLHGMHDDYVQLSKGVRPLLMFFLLSIVNQLIQALMFVPVLISLGAQIDLLAFFAVLPLSKAFIQFMPVPAGLGVAEGAQVMALTLAQVAPELALVVALVLRAIDLSMLLPAGLAYATDAWLLRRPAAS